SRQVLRDFKILNKRIENLQCKIEKISNKFIRDLYSNRVKEWYAYALLMDEQIEKSREVCHSILNVYDDHGYLHLLKVSALGYLGESYVDNYVQAIWYLNKGITLLNQCQFEKAQNRKKDFLNMRSYLRMIHGKDMHDLQIYDEGEWSLYYIVTGNRERAIRILRNRELTDGSLSPMKLCYLGWALEDKEILKKSIELFCSQGCKFYSYLPRKMLVDINKNGIIYTGDAK
ncbi:AimR family lysis-lysogeny pheromone receptor, partial [Bacillus toyonensis]|uniref:AimR family lysis-lysogeny pheromone receptor n=2 Tax=Bacillus toyonensis TaxID=155322 RepID=UPI000BFADB32